MANKSPLEKAKDVMKICGVRGIWKHEKTVRDNLITYFNTGKVKPFDEIED